MRRESGAAAIELEGVVADEWERFELRCVLSFAWRLRQLQKRQAPNTTLRGCGVRMEAAPTAVEASGRSGGRKRSRRGTTLAEES
jgi:hypothetical protein